MRGVRALRLGELSVSREAVKVVGRVKPYPLDPLREPRMQHLGAFTHGLTGSVVPLHHTETATL